MAFVMQNIQNVSVVWWGLKNCWRNPQICIIVLTVVMFVVSEHEVVCDRWRELRWRQQSWARRSWTSTSRWSCYHSQELCSHSWWTVYNVLLLLRHVTTSASCHKVTIHLCGNFGQVGLRCHTVTLTCNVVTVTLSLVHWHVMLWLSHWHWSIDT